MEKPRHDGLCSCVTRVHDSSLSILRAPASRGFFFFDVHTVARHGAIFYGILERFWTKGLVGVRAYVRMHVCMYNIYVYSDIILYGVSLNALPRRAPFRRPSRPTRFSEKRKYSGNSYTFYIISDKG